MKLIFDLSSAQPQGAMTVNGGGEYAFTVFTYIVEFAPNNDYVVVLNKDRGINTSINLFCRNNNIEIVWFANNRDLEILINTIHPNIIVIPVCYSFYYDLKINNDIKLITIIHDLTPIWTQLLKVNCGRYIKRDGLNWIRKIKNTINAGQIIPEEINRHRKLFYINDNQTVVTVSYFSKRSFELLLDLPQSKIDDVIVLYTPEKNYNSVATCESSLTYMQDHALECEKYFLFLAGCRWTKNNAIAALKIDELISKNKIPHDYKVVILGLDATTERYYRNNIKNTSNFIYDGYLEKNILEEVLKNTHLLVFPSILEGFGMPPIEVMKYGRAPACSTSMSIPEICGNGAIYFDPLDENSIEVAMLSSFDQEWMEIKNREAKKRFEELQRIRERDLNKLANLIFEVQ